LSGNVVRMVNKIDRKGGVRMTFVYSLFKGVFCNSEYSSNDSDSGDYIEYLIGKDVEGSGHGLI
jgi:hypothetical protein